MYTDLGVTCILPDFFRGEDWNFPDPVPSWETGLREDWEFKIQPYLIERGARRVGKTFLEQLNKNKNFYVVRNTECARSRYTLKLSLIFYQSIN